MVAINNIASAYSALGSLIDGSLSTAASTQSLPQPAATGPRDSVELSEQAKAKLARAEVEQTVADRLSAQVQAGRIATGKTSRQSQFSSDAPSLVDLLSNGGQQSKSWDANAFIDNRGTFQLAQQAAHTRSDGTIQDWSASASNVFNVPSTPADIDQWYQTQGQQLLGLARAFPDSMPGLAEAIQSHTITITDARDIPGLNFSNSLSFHGGEGGSGGSSSVSFNSSLPIFHDPNVGVQVMDNGTVITWPKAAAQNNY